MLGPWVTPSITNLAVSAARASPGPQDSRGVLWVSCCVSGRRTIIPHYSLWEYHKHGAPRLNSQHGKGHRSATNLHQPLLLAGTLRFTCNHVYSEEENPPQHLPGIFPSSSPSSAGVNSPSDFQAQEIRIQPPSLG